MEPSHYDVIVANGKSAFGVSVRTKLEADALADIFANSKTSVDVHEMYIDDFQQAAESIAKFLKGLF